MTTNRETWSIAASIDRPMPHGMHLAVQMESTRGVSRGLVDISDAVTPVLLVRGRQSGVENDAPITYQFWIDSNIDFTFLDSRIITLTVTD